MFSAWIKGTGGDERGCAAKTLKAGAPPEEKEDFLAEMATMKEMGGHPNVIGIIGHCLREQPYILLVELAEHGNLRDYLRKSRATETSKQRLDISQLLDITLQIANGMAFLQEKHVIHRDLAAYADCVLNVLTLTLVQPKRARRQGPQLQDLGLWTCPHTRNRGEHNITDDLSTH